MSYDSVDALASFAAKQNITYPLLSDEGSRVIRELGLLNEHLFEHHAYYDVARNDEHYGVPYAGTFVLDEHGIIADKRFQQSFRERETGVGLIEDVFDLISPHQGAETRATAPGVHIRAHLDSPTYAHFQRLRLTIELVIDPGFHVYGRPIPEGYVPLHVEMAPIEGLVVGEVRWPDPRSFTLPGLEEQFWTYEGRIRGSLPLTFSGAPGAGDLTIWVTLAFQVCSASDCLAPTRVTLELPVREVGLVDRPIRR